MIRFNSDYLEGAHPEIMEAFLATNVEQTPGYGEDGYCKAASGLIREQCSCPDADVHFFVGGTQTNLTLISAALRPHQGVISANTGHISVHESGAIEATGHKVLTVPSHDGKVTAAQVQQAYDNHFQDEAWEHMVQPKLVYISNPSEVGTIYTKAEMSALSETCRKNGLYLYMDGARLGYALCASDNDLDLPAIAQLCDAFYIGGTKIGALFGEALVVMNEQLKPDFRYLIKQRGGLLAKGRLLGVQFIALLKDGLYFRISEHANALALKLKDACVRKGIPFLIPTTTNQQFPILPDKALEKLREKYDFSYWQRIDETHSAVRFCTSWATTEENMQRLIADIEAL